MLHGLSSSASRTFVAITYTTNQRTGQINGVKFYKFHLPERDEQSGRSFSNSTFDAYVYVIEILGGRWKDIEGCCTLEEYQDLDEVRPFNPETDDWGPKWIPG